MSLKFVILGMLRDSPSSGYDLNKRLQTELTHIWVSEQSQIYRALYKMTDDGWVQFDVVIQEEIPNKKVYRITEQGEHVLEAWLRQYHPQRYPSPVWIAQLFFGSSLTFAEIQDLMSGHLNELRQSLQDFQQRQELEEQSDDVEAASRQQIVRQHLRDYHIEALQAEINHMEVLVERLRRVYDDALS